MEESCPLCESPATLYQRGSCLQQPRRWFRCPHCQLIFVHPDDRLGIAEERGRYRLHQNSMEDAGYRRFLSRIADPLVLHLAPKSRGIDFGCGPGPLLSQMLEEQGHQVALFDPMFQPDQASLNQTYDFVCCTETMEHFHSPARAFEILRRLLDPRGILALLTEFHDEKTDFSNWYYPRDPTHVSFYSRGTLDWIAKRHSLCVFHFDGRAALLRSVP